MPTEFCPYCMNVVESDAPCKNCGLTAGNYTPAPHHLPPGTILRDRYLIGRVLGEGGFGITYIGCDLQLELKVAIKEYFPTDKANRISSSSLSVANYSGSIGQRYEEGKARFLQEARTMAKMDKQPVIVSAKDFFEANNTAYIVMEYVEGTTLKDIVAQRGGRIPADELFRMMEPLFSALKDMHALGLIHRDISPENLMLERGAIRLLDFGCARESADGNATMTIALKHGYAPIEQYQNKGQGSWTDVYALSATMYYCLTGKKPPQSMDRLCEDELILPLKLGVNMSENQEKALLYGMGVRPRRRYRTVEELYAALYSNEPAPDADIPTADIPEANKDNLPDNQPIPEDSAKPDNTVKPQEKTARKEHEGEAKKNTRIIALAVAAAVLICIVLPIALVGAQNKHDAPAVVQVSEMPRLPEDNQYTAVWDWQGLVDMLQDDSVAAVRIPVDVYIETLNGLEVNKPLRIEAGAYLHNFHQLNISGHGMLIIQDEGTLFNEGVMRTYEGGAMVINTGGRIDNGVFLWNENAGDIYAAEGSILNLGEKNVQHLILNEEKLFENAVHVADELEYLRAIDNPGIAAVVIDGDLTLSPQNSYTDKPVMISEGVTVTALQGDDAGLYFEGAVLVNHGRLVGEINNGNMTGDPVVILNCGEADAMYHLANEGGVFINYGTWNTGGGSVNQGAFVNLGDMNFAYDGRNIHGYYSFSNHLNYNNGLMTFADGYATENPSHIELSDGVTFYNAGDMVFGTNSVLNNNAYLLNIGGLYFNQPENSYVDNLGIIEVYHTGELKAETGLFRNPGAVMYYQPEDVVMNDASAGNHVYPLECATVVNNEEELRRCLEDEEVKSIQVRGRIDLKEPITINKGVVVTDGIITSNADITIEGPESYIVNMREFTGTSLYLRDQAVYVQMASDVYLNDVFMDGGCTAVFRNRVTSNPNGGEIALGNDCRMILLNESHIADSKINIKGGSQVRANAPLYLNKCSTVIDAGSELLIGKQLHTDGRTTLINKGVLDISSIDGCGSVLGGTMENKNIMDITFPPQIAGMLINNGRIQLMNGEMTVSGSLENHGQVLLYDDACITGNITGTPAAQGTEWIYR
ncbi:MAG: serine/threonine protein kinase [Clostridia bacterium]|nr:serine/threonine protein kinase [Clostridia bacterium]